MARYARIPADQLQALQADLTALPPLADQRIPSPGRQVVHELFDTLLQARNLGYGYDALCTMIGEHLEVEISPATLSKYLAQEKRARGKGRRPRRKKRRDKSEDADADSTGDTALEEGQSPSQDITPVQDAAEDNDGEDVGENATDSDVASTEPESYLDELRRERRELAAAVVDSDEPENTSEATLADEAMNITSDTEATGSEDLDEDYEEQEESDNDGDEDDEFDDDEEDDETEDKSPSATDIFFERLRRDAGRFNPPPKQFRRS